MSKNPYFEDFSVHRSQILATVGGEKAQGDGTLCPWVHGPHRVYRALRLLEGGVRHQTGACLGLPDTGARPAQVHVPGVGCLIPKLCVGLKEGGYAKPCSLTPNGAGGVGVRLTDPAEWSAAMRAARCPYDTCTATGPRALPYSVERAVAHNRAIPVCPDDFEWPGESLPVHPQDDHTSWFYYRWEAGGPAHVPLQSAQGDGGHGDA